MAGEWRSSVVSDLEREGVLLVEDGNHGEYRPRPDEFVDHGVAFIRAADMNNERVLFSSAAKINERARQRITKGIGAPGDVLLSHKGTVGKIALVPDDAPPFVCSPQTTFWRSLNLDVLDRKFLYAFLRSPAFRDQLATRAGETDMAPYVSLTSQRGLSVVLPRIDEQRAIAHILGTLDDKIELNRRLNETLKAIAQAIFKSWFVDFDPVRAKASGEPPESICNRLGLTTELVALFPDRFHDSELGEVPEDWEVSSVGDLANVTSGKRPDDRRERWSAEYQVPLWGGNGPMGFVSSALYSKPILLTGRVGTLGSVFRISSPCWPSDNTLIVIPKNPLGYEFLFFRLIEIDFRSLNRGSTQPLLSQSDLKGQRYVLPSVELLESFHVLVRDIFSFIEAMNRETTRLADIRDTVLPKLLSGELPVPVVGDA